MKFVGFNFSKISIEKKSDSFKDLKINTNIDILDVKEAKNNILKQKEEIVIVKFTYNVDYQKNIATIDIEGTVAVALDSKAAKDLIKQWKDKKLSEDIKMPIFNVILRKSTIKAFELEDQMNLPLHTHSIPVIRKHDN